MSDRKRWARGLRGSGGKRRRGRRGVVEEDAFLLPVPSRSPVYKTPDKADFVERDDDGDELLTPAHKQVKLLSREEQVDAIIEDTDLSKALFGRDFEVVDEENSVGNLSIEKAVTPGEGTQEEQDLDDAIGLGIVGAGALAEVNEDKENYSTLPLNWVTIWTLMLCTGTVRFNDSSWNAMTTLYNFTVKENKIQSEKLPSVSTVKRTVRDAASNYIFAKTVVKQFNVDFSKKGARGGGLSFASDTTAPVAICLPSTWAKLDFATKSISQVIKGCVRHPVDASERLCFQSIEDSPIVKDRETVLMPYRITNTAGGWSAIKTGTRLVLRLRDGKDLRKAFGSSGFVYDVVAQYLSVTAEVTASETLPPSVPVHDTSIKKGTEPFTVGDFVLTLRGVPPCDPELLENKCWIVFRGMRKANRRNDYRVSVVFMPTEGSLQTWVEHDIQRYMVSEFVAKDDTPIPGFPARNSIGTGNNETLDRSTGVLRNGKRYVVYRFLLYADGFSPYIGKSGSMDGCYLMPLGIRPQDRTSIGAVRKISLAPPGIASSVIFNEIVEDIVEGTSVGFLSHDENGDEITIFLDCVGFIADTPAISEMNDLLGHVANVPCHMCLFERYDRSGKGEPRYAYTTKISSGHPSYRRNGMRMGQFRGAGLSPQACQGLGMKSNEKAKDLLLPLHALGTRLEEVRAIVPRNESGTPVVPAIFDPYLSCVIAPDHLFLGLGQNVLDAVISAIPMKVREGVEDRMKTSLRDHGLNTQNHIIDMSKKKVYSMSISDMYAVLLVAPQCFRSEWDLHKQLRGRKQLDDKLVELSIELLSEFQLLVSRTQFVPISSTDGLEEMEWFNNGSGATRLLALQEMGQEYVRKLARVCMLSEESKKVLDKPNVHRLLEFYAFTLPSFGNVSFVQELVLEKAHQELKRGLQRSNNHNAQLQAMEHAVANDWVHRLAFEVKELGLDPAKLTADTCRGVLRLLQREEWKGRIHPGVMEAVRASLSYPVLHELRKRNKNMASLIITEGEFPLSCSQMP